MKLKGFVIAILLGFLCFQQNVFALPLNGSVKKEDFVNTQPVVVDEETGMPVEGALVSIPSKNVSTTTNNSGNFNIVAEINNPVILSVHKDGYKPLSITIDKISLAGLRLEISKQKVTDIIINENLVHLGDDSFSSQSANSDEFKVTATGPSFRKEFFVGSLSRKTRVVLVIGSVIGIDTKEARSLRQNNISNASSSPVSVYVNSKKVGQLKINGDSQRIIIPSKILISNSFNTLEVETGVNLSQKAYVDYDDIEMMNLVVEVD